MSTEATQTTETQPTVEEVVQKEITQFISGGREDGDPEGTPEIKSTPAAEDKKPAEAAPDAAVDETAEESPKKRNPIQPRIDQLMRERSVAEQRARELEARLAELEKRAQPDSSAVEDKEPDPADTSKYPYGELDKAYLRDFAAHTARQEHRRLQAEDAKARQAREADQQQNEVKTKVQALVSRGDAKYDDFQDAINDAAAKGAQMTPELALLLAESEVGEDVVYHLAKHPEEAKALVAKSPLSMAVSFGKLEARFQKTEEKKAPVSKAPAPVQHARGGNGRFAVTGDTTDFEAFEASVMAAQR